MNGMGFNFALQGEWDLARKRRGEDTVEAGEKAEV